LDIFELVVGLAVHEFRLGIDFYDFVAGKANFIRIVNRLQLLDLSRLLFKFLTYTPAHYALHDGLCVLLFEQIFKD
jgi:hypothetical protein